MLDHVGVPVTDFARSKEFYTKALAPLGYQLIMEFDGAAGFGKMANPTSGRPRQNRGSKPYRLRRHGTAHRG